jgi:hypothetical protein
MPIMPAGVLKQAEIAEVVAQVERSLAPDVAHLFYIIDTDWSDDWAIYSRVVLSDDAGENRLRQVVANVSSRLSEVLDFQALGLRPYYNFRSVSEQAALREDVWR